MAETKGVSRTWKGPAGLCESDHVDVVGETAKVVAWEAAKAVGMPGDPEDSDWVGRNNSGALIGDNHKGLWGEIDHEMDVAETSKRAHWSAMYKSLSDIVYDRYENKAGGGIGVGHCGC